MDQQALIDRVRAGDLSAFAVLTERYHAMVVAYAYALLGDYHTAQDVAQETFLITYFNLSRLRDGRAFPGWLRGIVRHQCSHLLRRRRVDLVSLDAALDVIAPTAGPERGAEEHEGLSRILWSIAVLPQAQREVAALYFIKDYSRKDIAAFLGLPVTTVTNRLHAARVQLKDALRPAAIGRVARVRGPVVDVAFDPHGTPGLLAELAIGAEANPRLSSLMVAQYLDDGVVRCVTLSNPASLVPGMAVRDTGRPVSAPLPPDILPDALALLRDASRDAPLRIQETGIKIIDLLCPCPVGGIIGLAGDYGAGKSVVLAELLHNIALTDGALGIVAFVEPGREVAFWSELADPIPRTAALRPIYIAAASPAATDTPTISTAAAAIDALVYLSRPLIPRRLYPAVDPLRSSSHLLDIILLAREQHAPTFFIGLVFSIQTLGAIAGALIAPRVQKRFGFSRIVLTIQWLNVPLFCAFALTTNPLEVALVAAAIVFMGPIYNVVSQSYRLAAIPDELQGRVNSAYRLVALGTAPIGVALAGVLLQAVGPRATAIIDTGALLVMAVAVTTSHAVRDASPAARIRTTVE